MNSKGLFAYNKSTDVSFSVTMRNQAGTGSGYVEQGFNNLDKMDTLALSKIAAQKATDLQVLKPLNRENTRLY